MSLPVTQLAFSLDISKGTAAQWAGTPDYILKPFQIGFETDTRRGKLGDGVTSWTGLAYENGMGYSAKTEDYTVKASDSNTIFSNLGAVANITLLLPLTSQCVPGVTRFGFYVAVASKFYVNPAPADEMTFAVGINAYEAINGSPAQADIIGGYMEILCLAPGKWIVTSNSGGWTV